MGLQGECWTEPKSSDFPLPGHPLLDMKRRQCLVVTDNTFVTSVSKLWISNLYLRFAQPLEGAPQATQHPVLVRTLGEAGGLWMTDVTLQSDGARAVQGVAAASSLVAEGTVLSVSLRFENLSYFEASYMHRGALEALCLGTHSSRLRKVLFFKSIAQLYLTLHLLGSRCGFSTSRSTGDRSAEQYKPPQPPPPGLEQCTSYMYFCADCIVSRLGGAGAPISIQGDGTTATFSRSHFSNNVAGGSGDAGAVIEASGASSVWLQECTFTDNLEASPLGDSGGSARFFSDVRVPVWRAGDGPSHTTEQLPPTPQSAQFLNVSHPWLLTVQEVRVAIF